MTRRLRIHLVLASVGLALAAPACEWNDVATPRFGYEYEDIKCGNHTDDDYDGLVDCEDPDCIFTSSLCGEYVPEDRPGQEREDNFDECTDGIDNDYNGQFDCGDPKCQSIQEVCCFKEFSNQRCSDGVDNDQNGFADCGDFQCRNGMFVDICSDNPPCHPGDDCFGPETSLEFCQDERDNDDNGFVDCADFSCSGTMAAPDAKAYCDSLPQETSLEECTDGADNNGNGYVDCVDFSCSGNAALPEVKALCDSYVNPESSLDGCQDGIDNDDNGFVDCQDRACSNLGVGMKSTGAWTDDELAIGALCDAVLERGPDECSDGVDNDTNGYVDCADFSCRNSRDAAVQAVCQESLGETTGQVDGRCGDGVDNDGDGFADCDDWDCSWNPLVTVCPLAGEKRVCE